MVEESAVASESKEGIAVLGVGCSSVGMVRWVCFLVVSASSLLLDVVLS